MSQDARGTGRFLQSDPGDSWIFGSSPRCRTCSSLHWSHDISISRGWHKACHDFEVKAAKAKKKLRNSGDFNSHGGTPTSHPLMDFPWNQPFSYWGTHVWKPPDSYSMTSLFDIRLWYTMICFKHQTKIVLFFFILWALGFDFFCCRCLSPTARWAFARDQVFARCILSTSAIGQSRWVALTTKKQLEINRCKIEASGYPMISGHS